MARRLSAIISPNPDINENRQWQINWITAHNLEPVMATKEDVDWFWADMDLEIDSETAKEYVNNHLKALCDRYPFLLTEFFEEFYRYMPDCLYYELDKVGPIDWNLFFTLAYPLPPLPCLSFRVMINKLNWAQLRIVKNQIIEEIWNNKELRRRVLEEEVISSLYTQYIPYLTIRKRLLERAKKEERLIQEEKNILMGRGKVPEWVREATKLYDQGVPVEEIFSAR